MFRIFKNYTPYGRPLLPGLFNAENSAIFGTTAQKLHPLWQEFAF